MAIDKDYKGWKCPECEYIYDYPYCDHCEKKLSKKDKGRI